MLSRLRPIGPILALFAFIVLACQDGVVTAQPKAAPVAVAPQSPTINVPFPLGVQRGQTLELTLTGSNLNDPTAFWSSFPVKATFPADMNNGKDPAKLREAEVPADARLRSLDSPGNQAGHSNTLASSASLVPQIDGRPTTRRRKKPRVRCRVVVGKTDAEVSDFFKAREPGQRLTFEVIGRRRLFARPRHQAHDAKPAARWLATTATTSLACRATASTEIFPSGGEFIVKLRDTDTLAARTTLSPARAGAPARHCLPAMTSVAQNRLLTSPANTLKATPVEVTMPMDRTVVNVAPRLRSVSWPVSLLVRGRAGERSRTASRQRPSLARALRHARFLEKGDVTLRLHREEGRSTLSRNHEILSPAEVYLIVNTEGR